MFKTLRITRLINKVAGTTATPDPAATADPTVSQARLFGTAYAKEAAKEMLATIKKNGTDAELVTKICLGVSMPHQIGYILGLAPLQWDSLTHWLESITLIMGAVGIPVAVDFLILICIRTLAARAAATVSKAVAFVAMLFPIAVSGYVNFMAPAPDLIRGLFVVAVVLIPVSQGIRAASRPDFRKIDRMEHEVAQQVAATVVKPVRTATQAARNKKADKARAFVAKNRNVTVAELVRQTGIGRETAKRILAELGEARTPKAPANIPTSPAPAGMQLVDAYRS
jgi:ribosomal protein S25